MSANDEAAGHGVFIVGISRRKRKELVPYTSFSPATAPLVDIERITKAFRQITPGHTSPIQVQQRIHEELIAPSGHTDIAISSS